jgi:hypothetical protein
VVSHASSQSTKNPSLRLNLIGGKKIWVIIGKKHLIVIGRSQQIMLIISFSSSIIRSPTLDPHNIGILSANPFLNTNFPSQSSDTSLREEKLKDLPMNQGNSDENIP